MSVCGNIYTLPAPPGCGNIWAFPSQIHPGGGGLPSGPQIGHTRHIVRPLERWVDDEDALIALALLDLL